MADQRPTPDPPRYPGAPRWVKVSAIVAGILALLLILLIVTGVGDPHGPSRHLNGGNAPAGGAVMEGADR